MWRCTGALRSQIQQFVPPGPLRVIHTSEFIHTGALRVKFNNSYLPGHSESFIPPNSSTLLSLSVWRCTGALRVKFNNSESYLHSFIPPNSYTMVAVCHACGREFSGSRGLNTHLRFCKETLSWNSQLKRCIDDKERSDATKRARTGASVDLEEPGPCPSDSVSDSENGPELAPSPDLFPVSFSFSGCK